MGRTDDVDGVRSRRIETVLPRSFNTPTGSDWIVVLSSSSYSGQLLHLTSDFEGDVRLNVEWYQGFVRPLSRQARLELG